MKVAHNTTSRATEVGCERVMAGCAVVIYILRPANPLRWPTADRQIILCCSRINASAQDLGLSICVPVGHVHVRTRGVMRPEWTKRRTPKKTSPWIG